MVWFLLEEISFLALSQCFGIDVSYLMEEKAKFEHSTLVYIVRLSTIVQQKFCPVVVSGMFILVSGLRSDLT